jgi:hypothetical protein
MSTANAKAQQKNYPVERSGTVLQRLVITRETTKHQNNEPISQINLQQRLALKRKPQKNINLN